MPNIQQIQAQVSKSAEAAIDFIVSHNPTASYQFIQHFFPGKFQQMVPGFELNDMSQQQMKEFLSNRAKASGTPDAFIAQMSQYIPFDPHNI